MQNAGLKRGGKEHFLNLDLCGAYLAIKIDLKELLRIY
jgi:hypothetical protein